MSAKTTFFYCGACGFKNHPRPAAAATYVPDGKGKFDLVPGDVKCEQCGTMNTHPAASDYTPGAD